MDSARTNELHISDYLEPVAIVGMGECSDNKIELRLILPRLPLARGLRISFRDVGFSSGKERCL